MQTITSSRRIDTGHGREAAGAVVKAVAVLLALLLGIAVGAYARAGGDASAPPPPPRAAVTSSAR
jgi:hypothetical protein